MRVLKIVIAGIVLTQAKTLSTGLIPSSTSPADAIFHSWCDEIGIAINPSVRLITTNQSVAGRGVFSVDDLVQDERIAIIPTYAILHPANGANMFPDTASEFRRKNKDKFNNSTSKRNGLKKWFKKLKQRIFRRKRVAVEHSTMETWSVELTEYALAILQTGHPLSPWIQQWRRDDLVVRMFQKGVTSEDKNAIEETAKGLQQLVPELPVHKIMAALHIRLEQYEMFRSFFVDSDPNAKETIDMYNILCSRTIELADGVVGAVPFHDMINHSFEPNIGLEFSEDGTALELVALSDIAAGKELFLCYTALGKAYEENVAVWMLVQWGIPIIREDWKVPALSNSQS